MRNSSAKVTSAISASASGSRSSRAARVSTQHRGRPGDQRPEGRRDGADVAHQALAGVRVRLDRGDHRQPGGPLGAEPGRRRVGRGPRAARVHAGRRVDSGDALQARQRGGVAVELRPAVAGAERGHDHRERLRVARGEVGPDRVGHLPAGRGRGQRAVVGQAEPHAQERAAEGQQQRDHRHGDQHRPAHHRERDAVPQRAPGRAPGRPRAAADAEQVHAAPEQRQQRRQHDQRAGRRHHDHGDPRVGEGAQEAAGEHQQRGQRHRDRAGAEQHGAPGGADRLDDRRAGVQPAAQLLAVAGDDEQAVVDGQAEAERGGQVQRVGRDVGEGGQDAQHQQRAEDRDAADQQRQRARDDAAEDEREQDQGDRQGQRLGTPQVPFDLVGDLPVDLGGAAHGDARDRPVGVVAGADPGHPLAGRVLLGVDPGEHQPAAAVARAQPRRRGGPVGGDLKTALGPGLSTPGPESGTRPRPGPGENRRR